jgi:hypothetical protein
MSAPFEPGDLAMCVDADPEEGMGALYQVALARLIAGRVYRVTWVGPDPFASDLINVKLNGVGNADLWAPWGDRWQCRRFRKIEAPDTEISRQILACKPTKTKVGV